MDFKHRSRSSNYFSSPPSNNNISFFTQQALRAGFSSPDTRRRREYHRNPNANPNPNSNRNDIRESIQRELEKERIRSEIIAEEVYRRRILEDEVRRELMLERELAFWRGEREFGLESTMQIEHRVPLLTNFEHRIGVSPHREVGFRRAESLPFQRDPVVAGNVDGNCNGNGNGNGFSSSVTLKEIKELKGPVQEVNKDKVIFSAKPDETDLKRKATRPPVGALIDPSAGTKKPKTKEEWSCALCRVTATSERALNDHLQGKKHKVRETGLNAQRTGFGTSPLPKTGSSSKGKPIKVPGASDNPSSRKMAEKAGGETSLGKVQNTAAQELPATVNKMETSVKKEDEEAAMRPKRSAAAKPKKKFKYFCETCQVGAYSSKVMNAHKDGKRHKAKVMELNKTDETASAEMPAQKDLVEEREENKEPDMDASVEKGVVEENKDLYIAVVKETINKTPAQISVVEGIKECNEEDIAASVELSGYEEKKELYTTVVKESIKETYGGQVESNNESADYHVAGVEDEAKLLEIVGDDLVVADKDGNSQVFTCN